LEKYRVYLKMMIDGVTSNPFSATTLAPIELESTEANAQEVIDYTRSKYGAPKDKVEAEIREWSGTNDPFVAEKISQLAEERIAQPEDQGDRKESSSSIESNKKEGADEKVGNNSPAKNVLEPWNNSSRSKISSPSNNPGSSSSSNKVSNSEKPLHQADCSGCGSVVEVPFKPDGVRPVFCKDCLKNYQRERAKLESSQKESPNSSGSNNKKKNKKSKY
jgi:CxxC-x17-CxxC domain-containing protein